MRHPAKPSNILDNSKIIQTKFLLGCDPSYELKNVDDVLGQKFEVLFTLINAGVQQILRTTQYQFFSRDCQDLGALTMLTWTNFCFTEFSIETH